MAVVPEEVHIGEHVNGIRVLLVCCSLQFADGLMKRAIRPQVARSGRIRGEEERLGDMSQVSTEAFLLRLQTGSSKARQGGYGRVVCGAGAQRRVGSEGIGYSVVGEGEVRREKEKSYRRLEQNV
jgi:hypothetical protein